MNIPRDSNGVAHIVGLSGGKDSTAMALRLIEIEPRPYAFVCTPTGDELPEMFAHWRKLADLLGQPLIPIVGGTLKSVCKDEGCLPNFRMRFCTRRLKIEPFKAFLVRNLPAMSYIGLRADEEFREGVDHGLPLFTSQRYPLREWGWGVGEVLHYLRARGVTIPERTDCARCFFQRIGEWWQLWHKYPELYADAEAQEVAAGHTFRTPGKDSWPTSLADLRRAFESGRTPKNTEGTRAGMCRTCTL